MSTVLILWQCIFWISCGTVFVTTTCMMPTFNPTITLIIRSRQLSLLNISEWVVYVSINFPYSLLLIAQFQLISSCNPKKVVFHIS
jgi:hypothetical protein